MVVPATADTPDRELISLWQSGDEAAAVELVRRHTAPLARFLAAQGASDGDLDDLVQDAFFRAFSRLDGFRGGASFRTWLLTIGSNVLKDRRRRLRRREVLPLAEEVADPRGDPHGDAEAGATADRLEEGLARLPRLQREVFLLRAGQGLEYEEIAAGLKISIGSARVHYHHATKRLKEWIG